jgi:hypothetical protein
MNNQCHQFVNFVISEAPSHNKKIVEDAVCRAFNLVKDRKVYHNDCFAVRFSYSKSSSSSFSNTVLSLSALEKYDRIPFFVVLVRQNAENLIFLANSTLLKKISHSSQELSMTNIKGSFNGSDIIRDYEGVLNSPENFDYLFAIHQGLDWDDNLLRLVETTSNIKASATKYSPNIEERHNILQSVDKSLKFISSCWFEELKNDLDARCEKCKKEIVIASHIENVNIRGRLIESLITSNDEMREKIMQNLREMESALPSYDTKNGLGDYCRTFENTDTLTDIKTKVIYLNSNPKAYNIDKFLRQMSDGRSVFLFYFIGVDEHNIFQTLLCSVYHDKLIENTILQFHWAGRASRGVAQFNGKAIDEVLRANSFSNHINREQCISFLEMLLNR